MRQLRVIDAAGLAATYASADYAVVLGEETLPLRVGEPASRVEALWPMRRYVFISAYNPASELRSEDANRNADAALVERLDRTGAQRHRAWAQAENGQWHEPAWLVGDLDATTAETLAREFGQAAVLEWDQGQPVRLRMLMPRPFRAPAADAIHWAC